MSTRGEQSVLKLLDGEPALDGYQDELARPDLWNSPSGNYGPTAELTLNLEQRRDHDIRGLAESALRWERFLDPGVPGVAMRQEPDSGTYTPWIVCPISGAWDVHREHAAGQLAAKRAQWWCRAWLTWSALTMATRPGKLISDLEDPPGEYRPGPVAATVDVDPEPWTGSPYSRRNRGILPTVAVGERSWQRSHVGDDDFRLCRDYLDQSQISQIVQLALGIPWRMDLSETGDWPARFLAGLRNAFSSAAKILPVEDADLELIRRAWETKTAEDVRRVLPFLEGWLFAWPFVLARTEGGLWMLAESGGHTSTASTYGAAHDETTGVTTWAACDSGQRKSKGAEDAIVEGRGWEEGDELCCERSDGRYTARTRLLLTPADIILTASRGWLGRWIRRAEQGPGEAPSRASHAALVVSGGPWDCSLISEAVGRGVVVRTLHPYAEDRTDLKVLRPLNVPMRDLGEVVERSFAVSDARTRYAPGQLVLHLADAMLSRLRGREVVLFRRAISAHKFTTCARHVADCYRSAGYDFGVSADLCTPDHIDDWAAAHPGSYEVVWDWGPLPERSA